MAEIEEGLGQSRVTPQCNNCRWFNVEKDSCAAFPEPFSIPLVIKLNRFNHQESVWPGQNGEWRWQPLKEGDPHHSPSPIPKGWEPQKD